MPFKGIAGQTFARSGGPKVAPEIAIPLCALTGLDAGCHFLQFVPGFGRLLETVLAQEVTAVVQHADIGMKWHGDKAILNGEVGEEFRILCGHFRSKNRPQIKKLIVQQARPDHVNGIDIGGAPVQKLVSQF